MSRCFPYPPPGYTLSSARKEALIESIKLQKERVKSEERKKKKEKKREKKEKRKEKKNKTHQYQDKSDVVKGHIGEKFRAADVKGAVLQNGSKAEAEQLERSSLTEEHGEPLRLPSSSSDSTENSNKRKRHSSPIDDPTRGHGKIIRIRLSKKQNISDASANEPQTSGRTNFHLQNEDDNGLRQRSGDFCSTSDGKSNRSQVLPLRIAKEQISSSSQQIKPVVAAVKVPILESVMTPMQKIALQYKNLIENWVPPQLEHTLPDSDDLDWLFQGKKNQGVRSEKRLISGNDSTSCSSSSTFWPRAQYLQEVDVYALPYTVPF